MVTQIIGYPPGGGGHRYLRYLQGMEFESLGVSYDLAVQNQSFSCRYLIDDDIQMKDDVVLTHCLNQSHIRRIFGDNGEITILDFPLHECLRREWILNGRERYARTYRLNSSDLHKKIECYHAISDAKWPSVETIEDYMSLPANIQNEVDTNFAAVIESHNSNIEMQSAIDTITWHKKYYAKYPLDTARCRVLGLDDRNFFCSIMLKEFEIAQCEIFDRAWQKVIEKK